MIASGFILRYINILTLFFKENYKLTFLSGFLNKMSVTMNEWIASSNISRFIGREGIFLRTLKFSKIYIFVFKIIRFPFTFLKKLYAKNETILNESIVIKVLHVVLARFNILFALCILGSLIIPYDKWHNTYGTFIIILLFVLFFIKVIIDKFSRFRTESLDVYLIIYGLSVFLAVALSIFPSNSLRFIVFYVNCFLCVLLIVSSLKTKKELGLFIEIILAGITLTGIYGIMQRIVGVPVDLSQVDTNINDSLPGRVFSTMGNANDYAELLVLFIPFYFAIILNSKSYLKKILFILLSVPPILALLFTSSRSSWIGIALAVLVFTALKNWKLVPLIILMGLFFIPFLPQSIYRRILTIWNPNDSSASYRTLIYKTVQPVLSDYWFTGIGLGTDTFKSVTGNYHLYTKVVPPHCHNLLLQMWIETGFIGVLSFVGFLLGLLKRSVKSIISGIDIQIRNILIAGTASLLGVILVSMAEYIWFNQRIMLSFWIVVGILLAALNIVRKGHNTLEAKERK